MVFELTSNQRAWGLGSRVWRGSAAQRKWNGLRTEHRKRKKQSREEGQGLFGKFRFCFVSNEDPLGLNAKYGPVQVLFLESFGSRVILSSPFYF